MHFGRRFWPWLTVWTVVGLGIRLATVYGRPHRPPGGDPFAYYYGARLLAAGHGFINPFDYFQNHHQVVQSAAFAPLYTLALLFPMVLGLKSYFVARIWTCVLGAAGVAVCGYAGKEIGGRRVGLVAAFVAAIYPNLWLADEIGAAEALDPLLVATLLLCAYRFWKRPDLRRALWLGVAMGVLILARDELFLLILFVQVPLALLARTLSWRRRLALIGMGVLAAAVVVAPWVGYNLSRFERPTFVTNEQGITMASADCNTTFSGPDEGYWSMPCAVDAPVKWHGDESQENAAYQAYVFKYLRHHENRLFPVTMAKIGRAFGFFHPMQQIWFDYYVETRPYHWALTGLFGYYLLLALSIPATFILRRRRVPVFPLWAVGLNVVIAVAIAFGNTRYRTPFEVPLVLMGAVVVDWAWSRLRPSRPSVEPDVVEQAAEPAPPVLSGAHG